MVNLNLIWNWWSQIWFYTQFSYLKSSTLFLRRNTLPSVYSCYRPETSTWREGQDARWRICPCFDIPLISFEKVRTFPGRHRPLNEYNKLYYVLILSEDCTDRRYCIHDSPRWRGQRGELKETSSSSLWSGITFHHSPVHLILELYDIASAFGNCCCGWRVNTETGR